jgi:hypothetical protein
MEERLSETQNPPPARKPEPKPKEDRLTETNTIPPMRKPHDENKK